VADELAVAPAVGLRIVWDRAAVAAYPDAGATHSAWRLEGDLTPAFSALRVLSAATREGGLLLLAAARPADADGHAEEAVAALLALPDGAAEPVSEALISTEYAADGSIRRVGLELYKEGDDYPVRAAGDAAEDPAAGADPGRRAARLEFRLDGDEGVALYEIVEAA
jgi:hypothetical protein